MKTTRRLSVLFLVLTLSLLFTPKAFAATKCQCVGYVKNYFGILEAIGNAKDTGAWFKNHGFTESSKPVVGAAVVMQNTFPTANNPSVDEFVGHVGIVESVTDLGTRWKISVRGANQTEGGTEFTEFNCSNVRITTWSPYSKTNLNIKYYIPQNVYIRSKAIVDGIYRYMGIQDNSSEVGTSIIGQPPTGNRYQLFTLVKYGTIYKIVSRKTAMCIKPKSSNLNSDLSQKPCSNINLEKWTVIAGSGSEKKLKNVATGYMAQLTPDSIDSSISRIQASSVASTNNQIWFFDKKTISVPPPVTPTFTPTLAFTNTVAPTIAFTATLPPTITATATLPPTFTATIEPTVTVEPTFTATPTETQIVTEVSPTAPIETATSTEEATPTETTAPTNTPTETVTVSPTATNSPTPTVVSTPAPFTITPSLSPSYPDSCSSNNKWLAITNGYLTLNENSGTRAGRWSPNLTTSGRYKIEVYVPTHNVIVWPCNGATIRSDTSAANYQIWHSGGKTTVRVDQAPLNNAWVNLGTFSFEAGNTVQYIKLSNITTEANQSVTVSYGKIRFTYIGQ